uniref:Large ribosomal subunit protein bL12c n=1 Tax=Lepocinclis tripteris TaxID=135494 RepID=A0A3G3LKZ9_9EUGL|nr:ribosomal protein L12 [Lepocinclis tripteris]AYQ93381.1 ribosomal protein L12 [Lepocinclis tripteris]
MSEKVEKIIEELKNISLLEASQLVSRIEETFGVDVSSSRLSVSSVPISGASTKVEEDVTEEKTEFNVIITDVPASKRITVIKVIRTLTSLGLKEAKDLIETLPKPILENVTKERADEVKKLLEEAGAIIAIN